MKSINRILAVLCGAAVCGAAVYAGRFAAQYRILFKDFGVEVPSITKACVSTPFAVYLGMGLLSGALVTWLIWSVKPRSVSLPLAGVLAIGFLFSMWAVVLSVSVPTIELIEELRRGNPVATGEQRDAADSRQANGQ